VFSDELGLPGETAARIASGFGSGMRQGEVCGAVTGALMVLGLKYGQGSTDDLEAKVRANALAREFGDRFKALNGSIICRELLGIDIGTEEGSRQARNSGKFDNFCPEMIRAAVKLLEEMI
jgi:C_GCAxxG_C_C family probable redox protein